MTLPSRHRIRNFSPGSLGSSTLPLGHGGSPQYECVGKKHFVSLKLECQSEVRTRAIRLPKQIALTTAPGPPPTFKEITKQIRTVKMKRKQKQNRIQCEANKTVRNNYGRSIVVCLWAVCIRWRSCNAGPMSGVRGSTPHSSSPLLNNRTSTFPQIRGVHWMLA